MKAWLFVTKSNRSDVIIICKVKICMLVYHPTKFGCWRSLENGDKAINAFQKQKYFEKQKYQSQRLSCSILIWCLLNIQQLNCIFDFYMEHIKRIVNRSFSLHCIYVRRSNEALKQVSCFFLWKKLFLCHNFFLSNHSAMNASHCRGYRKVTIKEK